MKLKFDTYLLWPFGEKLIFAIVARSTDQDFTVDILRNHEAKIKIVPHCEYSLKKVFLLDFVL